MSTHNLSFRAEIRKINVYPYQLQFCYIKADSIGFKLHEPDSMMWLRLRFLFNILTMAEDFV